MNALITAHAGFLALGPNLTERRRAFKELFAEDLDADTLKKIREAIEPQCPIGAQIRKQAAARRFRKFVLTRFAEP